MKTKTKVSLLFIQVFLVSAVAAITLDILTNPNLFIESVLYIITCGVVSFLYGYKSAGWAYSIVKKDRDRQID